MSAPQSEETLRNKIANALSELVGKGFEAENEDSLEELLLDVVDRTVQKATDDLCEVVGVDLYPDGLEVYVVCDGGVEFVAELEAVEEVRVGVRNLREVEKVERYKDLWEVFEEG
jgi:hypothetical protein